MEHVFLRKARSCLGSLEGTEKRKKKCYVTRGYFVCARDLSGLQQVALGDSDEGQPPRWLFHGQGYRLGENVSRVSFCCFFFLWISLFCVGFVVEL